MAKTKKKKKNKLEGSLKKYLKKRETSKEIINSLQKERRESDSG